jgi:cell division protein DivIC
MDLSKLTQYLKNKWIATLLVFVIWMTFFDRNNIINQFELISAIKDLDEKEDFYRNEFINDSTELKILKNDTDAMEKFARERYLMKRDNEDVFVIVEKN